jgi:hypothetical protein
VATLVIAGVCPKQSGNWTVSGRRLSQKSNYITKILLSLVILSETKNLIRQEEILHSVQDDKKKPKIIFDTPSKKYRWIASGKPSQ